MSDKRTATEVVDSHACQHPGCLAHIDHGDALYRCVPFGEPFRGYCRSHVQAMPEPDVAEIASIIEDAN